MKYTPRDLESHDAIAFVLRNEAGEVLCFYHNKFDFWTIPLGKAEEGQSPEAAAIEEAQEECGITVKQLRKLYAGTRVYHREQRKVVAFFHLFEVTSYEGALENREPKKHASMRFMAIDELRKLPQTSDATKMFLSFIDEVGWD